MINRQSNSSNENFLSTNSVSYIIIEGFLKRISDKFQDELNEQKNDSKKINLLLKCPFYRFQNNKAEFHEVRKKGISILLEKMLNDLKHLTIFFSKKKSQNTCIDLSSEEVAYHNFQLLLSAEVLQEDTISKILLETFTYFQTNQTETNFLNTFFILKCWLFGISIPLPNPNAYPIHQAVIKGDTEKLFKLLSRSPRNNFLYEVDQPDMLGMTPLYIAMKKNDIKSMKILCDHGADPFLQTLPWLPSSNDVAILSKNMEVMSILVIGAHNVRKNFFFRHRHLILNYMDSIPDFFVELKWNVESSVIPFLKSFAPSDNYKIYKKGRNIRFDFTLTSLKPMNIRRGNRSIVFFGENHPHSTLCQIDHEKKKVQSLFHQLGEHQIELRASRQLKRTKKSIKVELKDVNVELIPSKSWFGNYYIKNTGKYKAQKYDLKCSVKTEQKEATTKFGDIIDFTTIKNYDSYLHQYSFMSVFNEIIITSNHAGILYEDVLSDMVQYYKSQKDGINFNSKFNTKPLKTVMQTVRKSDQKKISMEIWISKDYPLKMSYLTPVFDLISPHSEEIGKIKEIFQSNNSLLNNSFIVEAEVPLMLSIRANILFHNLQMTTPSQKYFDFRDYASDEESKTIPSTWIDNFNVKNYVSIVASHTPQELETKELATPSLLSNDAEWDFKTNEIAENFSPNDIFIEFHAPRPSVHSRND